MLPGVNYNFLNTCFNSYIITDRSRLNKLRPGTYYSDNDYYIFNITTFVQKYLDGEIEEPSVELFLPLTSTRNAVFRANANEPAFKLEFAYTIF